MGVVSSACFCSLHPSCGPSLCFTPSLASFQMVAEYGRKRRYFLPRCNVIHMGGGYWRCAAGVWSVVFIINLFIEAIRLLLVVYVVVRGSRSNNRGGKKEEKGGEW